MGLSKVTPQNPQKEILSRYEKTSPLFTVHKMIRMNNEPRTMNYETNMSLKIYTKVGDKGTTSLIGGTKILKSDLRIEAYGTVDELNSYIGLCNDLKEKDVNLLEKEIDKMNEVLPQMKSFILPGGHVTVSHVHIARCICRRAERCCVRLSEQAAEDLLILKYLNRLSDYLFVLARHTSHLLNAEEIAWKPRV